MPTNKYSLADYEVVISFPTGENVNLLLNRCGLVDDTPITIGGPGLNGLDGSFVGSIKVSRNKEVWSTEGDNTGSWVHNKNLDRTGKISIDINQISAQILTLIYITNAYHNIQETIGGLQIKVLNAYNPSLPAVAVAYDCYIQKVPDQDFTESAKTQSWEFTCGRIMLYDE